MAVAAPDRPETRIEPGYRGFLAFCRLVGFDIEPYQRRIARAALYERLSRNAASP
jgi:hypothetical protein